MKSVIQTTIMGLLLAPMTMQAQRCDSLRVAYLGRRYWNGDTLYVPRDYLTVYPQLGPTSQTPPSGYYTWYWWLNQLQGGSYFRSGSLTGASPTLSVPLNYSSHPTYYELWLIVVGNSAAGNSCTDSIRLIIRGDSLYRSSFCDSISYITSLLIGGRSVQNGGTITLPTGTYAFNTSPRDIIAGWLLTGPSGPQFNTYMSQPPRNGPIDTLYLTSPGMHQLRVSSYSYGCLDTLQYFIQVVDSFPGSGCVSAISSPCRTRLVVNNTSYLPGQFVQLGNGIYTFHLAPVAPPPSSQNSLNCYYTWRICGATIPGGCMSGQGSSFSAYIGLASYSVEVISRCNWICGITQVCTDTVRFTLSGGFNPNDTVIVSLPDTNLPYYPGDTIPLPLDTVCLYAGVQTLHPDSLYWWYWTYYGPNGQPLDSGITPVTCVYPTQGGIYSLTYQLVPPPNRRTMARRYTFYLNFGARSTTLSTSVSQVPLLYPNPTAGAVWIKLPDAVPHHLTLMDPTGRVIERQTVMGGQTHLLSLRLPVGLYILQVETGAYSHTLRLVVTE